MTHPSATASRTAPSSATSATFQGTDKLLIGIILGVITF